MAAAPGECAEEPGVPLDGRRRYGVGGEEGIVGRVDEERGDADIPEDRP